MNAVQRLTPGARLSVLMHGHVPLPAGLERDIAALVADSRQVVPGALFFARAGLRVDGAEFIAAARAGGAVAVVRQGPAGARLADDGSVELSVVDLSACMADAARRFHDDPSAHLRLVGVTGTNGKTSVCHFIAGVLDAVQPTPCGVLGTLGYGLHGALVAGLHTTPDVLDLNARLAELVEAGAADAVMEVSSHALDQARIAGLSFDSAVFTNLSRDHLDYHADMAAYGNAKRRLFETAGLRHAVLNLDDPFGARLHAELTGRVPLLGYGLDESTSAEVCGRLLDSSAEGLRLAVTTPVGGGEIDSRLVGRFNAANLLAALATLIGIGVPLEQALEGLARATPPPGRMERFGGDTLPLVVVDYAHTPDALGTVLAALRPQCRGRLWCVFGAGGDRDRGKRPLMGEVAAGLADRIVVTDDNPRDEDGAAIVADILTGIPSGKARTERDRARAITESIAAAEPGDIVLVAGKGHEPYQEIAGRRLQFSDAEVVRSALAARRGGVG